MTSFVAFQFRRGLSSLWTSKGTTLAAGEPGVELDSGRFKLGDGSTSWNKLPYFSPVTFFSGVTAIPEFVDNRVYLISGSIEIVGKGPVKLSLSTGNSIVTVYKNTLVCPVEFTFSHIFAANKSNIEFISDSEITYSLNSLQIVQLC